MARRLEHVPLDELVPALRNPKSHALAAIGRSIGQFGYVEPVVVDDRTGRLVAGHGRVEQLRRQRAAGEDPPEGIGEDWSVPVLRGWASRSDEEAEAYLVAANRLGEVGGWDDHALAELLAGVGELLPATGFTDEALAALIVKANPSPPGEFPEFGEGLTVEHVCPRCGYQYSGGETRPAAPAGGGS